MEARQALVAIGGRASRLRQAGVDVPVAKSFLEVAGKPLLYWCLTALHDAGVREIVLAADQGTQERAAWRVLRALSVRFDRVRIFRDKGAGVHCLPWFASRLLAERYIFECG